jgi:hypothetical protein
MGIPGRAPVIWRGRSPVLVASTPTEDPQEAVAALAEVLAGEGLHLLLLFSASPVEPDRLARAVQAAFPGVLTAGCSGAGLLGPGGPQAAGFVALGLCRPGAAAFAHLDDALPFEQVAPRVEALGAGLCGPQVLITLSEGSDTGVERLLVALGATSVPHVGAAAGVAGGARWVFAEGQQRRGGLVALRVAAQVPGWVGHTPAYDEGPESLIVTGLDEGGRLIVELDGWPAAQRMAELAGGPPPLLGRRGGPGRLACPVRAAGARGLHLDRPVALGEILLPLYPSSEGRAPDVPSAVFCAGAAGALLFLAQRAALPDRDPCAGAIVAAAHRSEGLDAWATSALHFGRGGLDA